MTTLKVARRVWPLGALAASIALVGGIATASIPSPAGVITGCVNKTSGAVRIIDVQAGDECAGSERTVAWSKGYRYRGEWESATSYAALDVVTFKGASYVASARSTGERPSANPGIWGLLAARGARGPEGPRGAQGVQGPQGNQGPQGPAGISTVTFGFAAPIRLENAEVFQLLLNKELPQGNWAITVTMNGVHDPRADNIWISCELRKGSDQYIGGTSVFESGTGHSMTMNGGTVIGPEGGSVQVFCRALGSIRIEGGQLMAMKVGGFS